jgi:L-ascorbate metabolism protein UlaG (beta-lactamase superfamily)
MRPRLLLASLLLPVVSHAQQPAGAPPSEPSQAPKPKVLGVDVTFLANAGFFLESGRYSILIDSFLREPTDIYAGLPDEVYKQLVNVAPPFDGLTIVLVSNDHPDHVQLRGLEKFLSKNPQAQLMTSPELIQALKEHARDFASIQRRLTPIPTEGDKVNKIVQEEMSIEFFQLEHGRSAATEKVVNIGHLVEMGGVKMLFVGDAKPSAENFAPYHLNTRGIDVAFVPYWFFGSPIGVKVLNEDIKPRTVVVCHVPPTEQEKFSELLKAQFPDVILFKQALEKRSFQPAGAKPAGGEGG